MMIQTPPTQRYPGAQSAGDATSASSQGRRRTWFAITFGAIATLLTVSAIVLAFVAPMFDTSTAPSIPENWSVVYDKAPNSSFDWANRNGGCLVDSAGLDATGSNVGSKYCTFIRSETNDLLSGGFLLNVQLAPGSQAPNRFESAEIRLGDTRRVIVDQSGNYAICGPSCSLNQQDPPVQGASFAFHGAGYTPNTITLRWLGPGSNLELYINGQLAATAPMDLVRSAANPPVLYLGATASDEAIFTHVTLYSASL
jgi:hypothetical protein